MKVGIFSCIGLGDGLLALILANNLAAQGHAVTLFHPSLTELQSWFPDIPIHPFPAQLPPLDRIFIFYEKTDAMDRIIKLCQAEHPESTTILNPIATPNTDYPYWEEGQFDGRLTFADNLYHFCRDILTLPQATKHNGIAPPEGIKRHKFSKRVVIHPTSSRPGKNWAKDKYLQLAKQLQQRGFEPVFIVSPKELPEWPEAQTFPSLSALATFVAESGSMIGNDSGIGHLASCLGLPTVTICKNERTANFWRPAWSPGKVCLPYRFVPNLKGWRLRDEQWQKWISVNGVLKSFLRLI
jgi:heptosyltransferase III